jgi:hypothetical protein
MPAVRPRPGAGGNAQAVTRDGLPPHAGGNQIISNNYDQIIRATVIIKPLMIIKSSSNNHVKKSRSNNHIRTK